MSFLKIKDPAKRDATVKEFLELKKNIRSNLLSEKVGEMEIEKDLSKLFKPITETQKEADREITEELKPIKEGIEAISFSEFPAFPSIKMDEENILQLGPIANEYLRMFTTKDKADKTFGIYDKNGKFYIGDKLVVIVGDDLVVGRDEYEGTPGLWELIVSKKPTEGKYDNEDMANYKNLMLRTNSLHRNNDPTSPHPKATTGTKWDSVIKDIWYEKKKYKGKGVIVIPIDPNALLERLDLLLASQDAGHTGVGNELVSICDELRRQEVINDTTYKKLNSIIKK